VLSGGRGKDGGIGIERSMITDTGVPIVILTNKQSYGFDRQMNIWFCLAGRLGGGSLVSNNWFGMKGSCGGTMAMLQKIAEGEDGDGVDGGVGDVFNLDEQAQIAQVTMYLETQISIAITLGSRVEYKYWLHTYVRYLTMEGISLKLEELCDDFMGEGRSWKQTIGGDESMDKILEMNKRDILREILPIIGKNRSMQRLVHKYSEMLNLYDAVGEHNVYSMLWEGNLNRPLPTAHSRDGKTYDKTVEVVMTDKTNQANNLNALPSSTKQRSTDSGL